MFENTLVSEKCKEKEMLCYINGSIDLSTIISEAGNLSVLIVDNKRCSNNVYSSEIILQAVHNTTDTVFPPVNDSTYMKTTQLIIPSKLLPFHHECRYIDLINIIFIIYSYFYSHAVTVGGGALGTLCLICLSAIILGVFLKYYNKRGSYMMYMHTLQSYLCLVSLLWSIL